MIDVLVVDDSAFMRQALSTILERENIIRVVGTARDGKEAVAKVHELQPDVVTMDVEMPRMNGLDALRRIMEEVPRPVLMISSLTRKGADATVEALSAGAVDFIPKQTSGGTARIMGLQDTLIRKVKSAAGSSITRPLPSPSDPAEVSMAVSCPRAKLVAIGVSTGGPMALQQVIPVLPKDCPVPVVIVQHMPPHFTRSLAKRLNTLSELHVQEAEDDQRLSAGTVAIAPGDRHLLLRRRQGHLVTVTSPEPSDTLHRPSADVTFQSASEAVGSHLLALVMTGMGKDGLQGARSIKKRGGVVFTQDETTSVVYGMPRAVVEAGLSDATFPLKELAGALTKALSPSATPARPS